MERASENQSAKSLSNPKFNLLSTKSHGLRPIRRAEVVNQRCPGPGVRHLLGASRAAVGVHGAHRMTRACGRGWAGESCRRSSANVSRDSCRPRRHRNPAELGTTARCSTRSRRVPDCAAIALAISARRRSALAAKVFEFNIKWLDGYDRASRPFHVVGRRQGARIAHRDRARFMLLALTHMEPPRRRARSPTFARC